MLEVFAASFLSLVAAPAPARLEDEPPAEVSCVYTCGLPGRQQTSPQHADLVIQIPPLRPAPRAADSPQMSSLHGRTQASASTGHEDDYPPGFGPVEPTVAADPPTMLPVDAHQTVDNDPSANRRQPVSGF
jgi:hypothetical protein